MHWFMNNTLQEIAAIIAEKASDSPEHSYTAKLLSKGNEHMAKKLGEEAVECALAAVREDRDNLVYESADLLYHWLVLMHANHISLDEVFTELARRKGVSGIEEKQSRKE